MSRPFYAVATLVAGIIVAVALMYTFGGGSGKASVTPPVVSDVQYGIAYPVGHTFLCVNKAAGVARDWHLTDRWVKNQLSYDTYTVDGRVYNSLRIVTDDPTLPKRHVRFRKVVVNIGTGPTLEGHSYLSTLIDGHTAKMERELLFVEFNGQLERQRRPLPVCGKPRS